VSGPAWPRDILTVVMIMVALYCAVRPAAARWRRRTTDLDTDGAHVVMGAAMAGMLTASVRLLPNAAWEAVFACGTGWFAWRAVRVRRGAAANRWSCAHPVPHLVECGAMLYMLAATPAVASRLSVLALAMALFILGYVAGIGNQLTPGRASSPHLAPRWEALCKMAMGITMGYALVLML
jgi:hypothetical protein